MLGARLFNCLKKGRLIEKCLEHWFKHSYICLFVLKAGQLFRVYKYEGIFQRYNMVIRIVWVFCVLSQLLAKFYFKNFSRLLVTLLVSYLSWYLLTLHAGCNSFLLNAICNNPDLLYRCKSRYTHYRRRKSLKRKRNNNSLNKFFFCTNVCKAKCPRLIWFAFFSTFFAYYYFDHFWFFWYCRFTTLLSIVVFPYFKSSKR